jgi:hypothetical protein
VPKLLTDALELPAHIHFGSVKIDVRPWQAEDLAQAQAKDQHQHVPGVERVKVVPR